MTASPLLAGHQGSSTDRSTGPSRVSTRTGGDVEGDMTSARAAGGDPEGELARLIQDAGAGDAEAHGELAERYRGQVTGWAARVLDDADEAEDVAQGVLGALARKLTRFRGESRFTTWLFQVTRNAALDRKRTEARRRAIREGAGPELVRHAGAVEDAGAVDLVALLRSYDTELTPREREVFRCIDLEGLDTTTAARRLGIQGSTVRVLLARARATLRRKMLERHRDDVREAGYDV